MTEKTIYEHVADVAIKAGQHTEQLGIVLLVINLDDGATRVVTNLETEAMLSAFREVVEVHEDGTAPIQEIIHRAN